MPTPSTHHINSMMVRNMATPGRGYVGIGKTNNSTDDTHTLVLPAGARQGDHIIIAVFGDTVDSGITKPSGRGVSDAFNSFGASWDVEVWRWDHDGGADLQFTSCGTGSKSWVAVAFRGYSDSGETWDGLSSGAPNPPSITNSNNVFVMGMSSDNTLGSPDPPTGYRMLFALDLGTQCVVGAIKWGTSGTESPGTFTSLDGHWTAGTFDLI